MAPFYHLTPRTLVGERFAPGHFGGLRVALLGFCPPPARLGAFAPDRVAGQPFIHLAPDSVRVVTHRGLRALSLVHVYGEPVSSATMEELAYYGIDWVLAYGLAGGLGAPELGMGAFYAVESAVAFDGTTPHYAADPMTRADPDLLRLAAALWPGPAPLHPVRAATGDAIYREDGALLDRYRSTGAQVVNLDSAPLYAAALVNSEGRRIAALQCGVVTDVVPAGQGERAESTLSAMLATAAASPLDRVGEIVAFYLETLAPALLAR